MMDWIDDVAQAIAELDYSSIEGQPEVMQVTAAELRVILERSGGPEIERLRSGASAYDALLRANGPSWLQRVSGGSYMDAVADCKRAGWRPDPSHGWPDTDAERSAEG